MARLAGSPAFAASVLVITLGGCGGGGAKSGPPDGGGSIGTDGGGSIGTDGGGGGSGGSGVDGGDDGGGQVLPPYLGRIVVTPAALLFTDAGQSATLHAQAFDATGAPMPATFTFTSSRPEEVAVDPASGAVTSMMPLGSTQVRVTGAGLTSRPVLVLVVKPQPGTVLVSDAQVVTGPTPVDPTADPLPGAEYQVTLDGVVGLAPGTMLVSREGNPVAGQVVSTAPNGTHTDVVYQLVALANLFARLDLHAGWDYDLQTAVDDDAIAAMAAATGGQPGTTTKTSPLFSDEYEIGPFKCKVNVDPTLIKLDANLSVTPDLHFDAAFSEDDNGNWVDFRMIVSGEIKASGKVTAKIGVGASASLSCKYKWREFIPPVFGPLSAALAPRVEVGVKGEVKGTAILSELDMGGKMNETGHFQLGFDDGVGGAGDIASLTVDDPHFEPSYSVNTDVNPISVEISLALGAYASLNVTAANFGLAEAFLGAKLKYQMMTLPSQVGSENPNNYQLKAPVREVGPGSDIKKVLALLGIALDFKTTINDEGSVIGTSPFGTFTADNKMLNVPVKSPVTFTINLDPSSTTFLGISNVTGVHIYRSDMPLIMDPPNEVKYLGGAGPSFTWTWTPDFTDTGPHLFFAATDDQLLKITNRLGRYDPFYVAKDSKIQIDVGPTAGNWGGTAMISWTGSGQGTGGGGNITVSGNEMITWVPGMPSPDGVSFDMIASSVVFNYTETHTDDYTLGTCPVHEVYQGTVMVTLTGADADEMAHGRMTVIPLATGSSLADYDAGVPGLSGDGSYNDDTTSDCTTPTHNTGIFSAGAQASPMMGTIKADATSISDGANYMGSGPFGIPISYTSTWDMQKM